MGSTMSLLDVPDVAKIAILEKCNLVSIMALRKTCHDIRNFIDDVKPQPTLFSLNIGLYHPDKLDFSMTLDEEMGPYPMGGWLPITYRQEGDKTTVTTASQESTFAHTSPFAEDQERPARKQLPNQKFIDVFCHDVNEILKLRTTPIGSIQISINDEFDSEIIEKHVKQFHESLKSLKKPIKVKNFFIYLEKADTQKLLDFLPLFDSKFLEEINISKRKNVVETFPLEKINELEQWKAAKKLYMDRNFSVSGVREILSFEEADVHMTSLKVEEVILLKEEFLKSATPKHFQIQQDILIGDETEIINSFGPALIAPLKSGRSKKNWIFPVPNTNGQLLSVNLYEKFLTLFKIEAKDAEKKTDPTYNPWLNYH